MSYPNYKKYNQQVRCCPVRCQEGPQGPQGAQGNQGLPGIGLSGPQGPQ